MGREVRRVPLDFDAPLKGTWQGYENPYMAKLISCTHCEGSGDSPEARRLKNKWYGFCDTFNPEETGSTPLTVEHPTIVQRCGGLHLQNLHQRGHLARLFNSRWSCHLSQDDVDVLVEAGRLREFTHDWTGKGGWVEKTPAVKPVAAQVNEWALTGMGHDSINCYLIIKARLAKEGVSSTCEHCAGEGSSWPTEEDRLRSEAWERTEPPVGEGWQMWQTVSDGPYTPVFKTPEELARYCADHPWGAEASNPVSYETWLSFIQKESSAPSFVGTSDGLVSGVQALSGS